jgi:hypothetical protein
MHRLLCNSWPKAGTHVLLEFARLHLGDGAWYHDPDIKYPSGPAEFVAKVDERIARHGASAPLAIKGHFGRHPVIEEHLAACGFRHLFAVRDPREVICSTWRWLRDLRPQWEISRFLAGLSPEEQLAKIITGLPVLPPFDLDRDIQWEHPLLERYAALTAWLEADSVCVLRYEDLAGREGVTVQCETIERALAFVGADYDAGAIVRVALAINNPRSATYHTGPSSDWRRHFTERHRHLFVETGGEDLVRRLGYAPTLARAESGQPAGCAA